MLSLSKKDKDISQQLCKQIKAEELLQRIIRSYKDLLKNKGLK